MEFAQAAERGLAGAEIVERDADADAAQILDDLLGGGRVVHQAGFGDLDLQTARIEAGAVEDRQYVQAGILVDELRGRQVEGQEQIASASSRAASVALRSTSCDSGPMMPRSSAMGMKTRRRHRRRDRDRSSAPASRSRWCGAC